MPRPSLRAPFARVLSLIPSAPCRLVANEKRLELIERGITATSTRRRDLSSSAFQRASPVVSSTASVKSATKPTYSSKSTSTTAPTSTATPTSKPTPTATTTTTTSSSSSSSPPPPSASFPPEPLEPTPRSLTDSLSAPPPLLSPDEKQVDWTRSFHGLSSVPFTPEQSQILQQEIPFDDIEIKPDGIIYLPEIKYRRILNKAFGPGGWGLAPRGETIVTAKVVTREYGLVAMGRLISIARGEQQYFDPDGIPTATEGCKSNALMRCCKDLGIASELWDPRFIRKFLAEKAKESIVEHVTTKKRRRHWMRKDDQVRYPYKEVSMPK